MDRNHEFSAKKSPKQDRSTQTVDAILEAVVHILEDEKNPSLTTHKIAEKAGVSIGSLYQYFPNKESILASLVEKYLSLKMSRVTRLLEETASLPIDESVDQILHMILEEKTAKRKIEAGLLRWFIRTGNTEVLRAIDQRTVEAIGRALRKLPEKKRPLNPEWSAFVIYQAIRGVLVSLQWHPERSYRNPELRQELRHLLKSFLN